MKRIALAGMILALAAFAPRAAAQQESPHSHHAGPHKVATQAKLEVGAFKAGNMVTLRVGPLDLPANFRDVASVRAWAPQLLPDWPGPNPDDKGETR